MVEQVHLRWRKSSRSGASGACVEAAFSADGVLVRDSKDPDGPRLAFSNEAWTQFIRAVRDGRLAARRHG